MHSQIFFLKKIQYDQYHIDNRYDMMNQYGR